MSKSLIVLSTVVGSASVVACGAGADGTAPDGIEIGQTSEALRAPALPSPTLAVPAGNEAKFAYDAIGVQIYTCSATVTGFGWVFKGPEATLYDKHGNVAGKHFAGPAGSTAPTWQSTDGSSVVGSKQAAFTADPKAIPELLLKAVSHSGTGVMSAVTYIQRLDTTGGLAPATGCDATTVGTEARIDYTATYFFSEADDGTEGE